jgi:hypothetical protein
MKLTGTYKFIEQWSVEIVAPTLEVVGLSKGNPAVSNINFTNAKYSVLIILKTESINFKVELNEVQAVSLDWASGGNNLQQQVCDRLAYFEVDLEGNYINR